MIAKLEFKTMLRAFYLADMKFPISFNDGEKINSEKITFWYDQLKGVIRDDLPGRIVEKIVAEETEFPRIAKIRWWAERLESETPDPKLTAAIKKRINELDKEKTEAILDNKTGQKKLWEWKGAYPVKDDIPKRTKVTCDKCQRPYLKGQECLCVKIEVEKDKVKKLFGLSMPAESISRR